MGLAGVAGVSSPSAGVRTEAWNILLLLEGGVSFPCSLETALRDVFALARLTKRPTMKSYRKKKNSMSCEYGRFDPRKKKTDPFIIPSYDPLPHFVFMQRGDFTKKLVVGG